MRSWRDLRITAKLTRPIVSCAVALSAATVVTAYFIVSRAATELAGLAIELKTLAAQFRT